MSRRNRNKLVVPESRQALNQFKSQVLENEGVVPPGTKPEEVKYEVAEDLGIPLNNRDNGSMTTENAGKIGGQIGGKMVREMVRMAQEQLARKKK